MQDALPYVCQLETACRLFFRFLKPRCLRNRVNVLSEHGGRSSKNRCFKIKFGVFFISDSMVLSHHSFSNLCGFLFLAF